MQSSKMHTARALTVFPSYLRGGGGAEGSASICIYVGMPKYADPPKMQIPPSDPDPLTGQTPS